MALSTRSLSRVHQVTVGDAAGAATARIITNWLYATDDAAATVEAANYFNGAFARLSKGDIIDASMVNGGTPIRKAYIVTSATGAATVVVALLTTTAG